MTFRQGLGAGVGVVAATVIALTAAGTAGAAPWGSTLEPGESSVATAFDCGFSPILLHVVTTSNGDGNWTDNALYFEL